MAEVPSAVTRTEKFMSGNAEDMPTPVTREEKYLKEIAEGGGGGGSSIPYSTTTPTQIGTWSNGARVMRIVVDNVSINGEYNLVLSASQISALSIARFLSITGISASGNFSHLKAIPYSVSNNALSFKCDILTPGASPSLYIVQTGSTSYDNAVVTIDYIETI